ncbi:Aste57867_15228 [Aphanomyces stellatus]|uniref:Aste57867_15228 protein n=1 Tax=Aphanomyces stellatus TaxID=120398 RepID=A0A485L5J3_9STRA|nr:hypothetical protein As57867_015172 [Aphanomyces stellatus]VFT92037.1 Aste57867_15228 [Aphanomyces stellatus]
MAATLIAGSLFGANLQLLTYEEGYFDASIKENPLLHLWSLGVEEQFYIFWPVFAVVVVRLRPRDAILAQLLVMVASFGCKIAFLGFHGDNEYSFYFPLSRFWQMSVGGLLAYINSTVVNIPMRTTTLSPETFAALSTSDLTAILVGFAVLDETKAFPGYWALLPTLGAAGLIFSGPATPFNKYILGSAPLVFVGHISYALYLWHWPLLVFARKHYPILRCALGAGNPTPWFSPTSCSVSPR